MLYDRREDVAYAPFQPFMIRAPPIDSALSDTVIYGVVYTQVRRFAMRNSRRQHFIYSTLRYLLIMLDEGYSKSKMLAKVAKFLLHVKHKHAYGLNSGGGIYAYIVRELS